MHDKYYDLGRVYGYLNAIGNEKISDYWVFQNAEEEAAKESIGTGLSVFTTVAGAAISGPGAPAWAVGSTVLQPIIVDQLASGSISDLKDPIGDPDAEDPVGIGRSTLETQAYAEAANHGLMGDDALNSQYVSDMDNGGTYSWAEEGKINIAEVPNESQNVEIHSWANRVRDNQVDNGVVDEVNHEIDAGLNGGRELITGGKDAISIKK